jgi:hypothetical protein
MNFKHKNDSVCHNNQDQKTYFNQDLENNPHKHVFVFMCAALSMVTIVLACCIIWYEKFGSDKKRTIVNLLVSSICWNAIVWNVTIQSVGIARILSGPFHQTFCFWHYILRRALLTQLILVADAITLIRYLFIFWLQNPGAFNDEFWNLFINLWTIGMSFILQFTKSYLPHPKIYQYNLCIGHPPDQFENSIELGVESLSFLLQMAFFALIKINQLKKPFIVNLKTQDLALIEKYSLVKFTFKICFVIIVMFAMTYYVSTIANQLCFKTNIPSSILVPFTYLIFTSLMPLLIIFSIFSIHPRMKKSVYREIKIHVQSVNSYFKQFSAKLVDCVS